MPLQQILTRYWGFASFRPMQEDIIRSVLDGNDTLALLPTGGGKSVCFQVPALAREGICIVVSPLIALMKDQVESLRKKGIKALAVMSGMSRREIDIALDNCIHGNFKFLYLSPERLTSELVRTRIGLMAVNLFAVDEAHCISQWGYDFRPSYLKVADIRALHPDVPVMALTATATADVKQDICDKLLFRKGKVFQQSFERKNLSYVVLYDEDRIRKATDILGRIQGSAIVYVRNRRKTREIADHLNRDGIAADFYHAGLDTRERHRRQTAWLQGATRVMVCTNAFGMGIDKPDVRTVIHMDMPDAPEAYFQEAGRAGRDGRPAYAALFYGEGDPRAFEQRFQVAFPPVDTIRRVYHALGNHFQVPVGSGEGIAFNFSLADFCRQYNLHPVLAFNALKMLEQDGYVALSDSITLPSRLLILVSHLDLYRFQVENPGFDPFIKTLLRMYEGLFDDYVRIDEQLVAKRAETDHDRVVRQLLHLRQAGIIDYRPATDEPQLVFTTPRLPSGNLELSGKALAERKERYRRRAAFMLRYASSLHQCRSRMLLSYFGEKSAARCGTCDYCKERNRLDLNELEFEAFTAKVRTLTSERAVSLRSLVHAVDPSHADKALLAIQWMIDNHQLRYRNDDELSWIGDDPS